MWLSEQKQQASYYQTPRNVRSLPRHRQHWTAAGLLTWGLTVTLGMWRSKSKHAPSHTGKCQRHTARKRLGCQVQVLLQI